MTMIARRIAALTLAGASLLAMSGAAQADDTAAAIARLERQMARMRAEIAALKAERRRLPVAQGQAVLVGQVDKDEATIADPATGRKFTVDYGGAPSFAIEDAQGTIFSFKPRGRIYVDAAAADGKRARFDASGVRTAFDDLYASPEIDVPTARLGVEGTIMPYRLHHRA